MTSWKRDACSSWAPAGSGKQFLTRPCCLPLTSPSKHSCTQTINGCGWCLMQKTKDGQWRLVQCGSISLKDVERRYSVIDTDLLAMTYGILKCSYYLKGCKFTVVSDHRPLVALSKKGWDQLTARHARLFEKIQGNRYEVQFLQGKYMYLAAFLSRSPVHAARRVRSPRRQHGASRRHWQRQPAGLH